MKLVYSGKSKPSALKIAEASNGKIQAVRWSLGGVYDVNWGCASVNAKLNPDISNSTNKRIMRNLFREHEVPMPALLDAEEVRDMLGFMNFVGRPDQHMKGRGYWLIKTEADLERALRGTRRKKAATHFMEYIESDREYRVHVFRGKSIRISEKKFEGDGTDKHNYTTIKPTCPVKRARKAAKQAVEALGLDFGAVDILVQEDGEPFVLEVNSSPGIGGSLPNKYAEQFIKYFEER